MIIRDSFCLFSTKTYIETPYVETVQIRGHNIFGNNGFDKK